MAISRSVRSIASGIVLAGGIGLASFSPASAEAIANKVAEFSGLDKITGRIITFDVYIDETVQFGALQVTPRVCYNRPLTETPKTTSFVEIDEITLDNKVRRIFTGWMFADSPGLHAVEHPVYDIWLTQCKSSSTVPDPNSRSTGTPKAGDELGEQTSVPPLTGDGEASIEPEVQDGNGTTDQNGAAADPNGTDGGTPSPDAPRPRAKPLF